MNYVMEQGERISPLLTRADFLDSDGCCVDLLEIPGDIITPDRIHLTFTEIFLYKSGKGCIWVDGIRYKLEEVEHVVVHKGQKHHLEVESFLSMYSICLPKFDIEDENKV